MPSRRSEIALSPEEVRGYLDGARTMVLVTTGPDGVPDPVPMWFVLDDEGRPLMRTFRRSQKVVNLRRDPRVAVLVEDGETYGELRGVQMTGRVELLEDLETVVATSRALAERYADGSPATDPTALAPKQVALRLHPDRVVSWDHRKIRGAAY